MRRYTVSILIVVLAIFASLLLAQPSPDRLTIVVEDASGAPIPGASVLIQHWAGHQLVQDDTATTDAQGRVNSKLEAEVVYHVFASAPGFVPAAAPVGNYGDTGHVFKLAVMTGGGVRVESKSISVGAQTITPAATNKTSPLELSISGTVLDREGAVIIAQIDLYSGKHDWHATTDAAGRFSFPALLPGTYDLEITSRGFRKQIFQNIRIDSSAPAPMAITMPWATAADSCVDSLLRHEYLDTIGESAMRGEAYAVSAATVSVPRAGVTVSLLKSGSEGKPLTTQTNDNGKFDFAGLEPGLYQLKASREGLNDFTVSNVRVRPGKILRVNFSMQPSGNVTVCQ